MSLALDAVSLAAGGEQVLHPVTLELPPGLPNVLLGPTGAGKTTLLRLMAGLDRPSAGRVLAEGRDVTGMEPFRIARLGLGYVPEERRIFTDLTVYENLEVGRKSAVDGREAWSPERLFTIFPNLAEMKGRRASAMSGGEQQMLTIARTLMGNPHAVLLDEPSEGLAPVIVEQMAEAVLRMKLEGIAVLLSEQNLHFASAVSDRAYVIERGQIRYQGTVAELSRDEAVRDAYLTV